MATIKCNLFTFKVKESGKGEKNSFPPFFTGEKHGGNGFYFLTDAPTGLKTAPIHEETGRADS